MENRSLHILGSSAAVPTKDRWHTAQVLEMGQYKFLLDCGEGTQYQLIRYGVKYNKIQAIFISHLHGDHFLGIFGLLNSMSLGGRNKPLTIYGPDGLQALVEHHLETTGSKPEYELHWVTLKDQPEMLIDEKDLEVWSHPVQHRVPCFAFKFIHGNKQRNLNVEACLEHEIPVDWYPKIKEGEDYVKGDVKIRNEELSYDPKPGVSYTFVTDTLYSEALIPFAYESTWMYHESTFLHEEVERAHATFHSTAQEAGMFGALAKVKHLILGHFSSRYLYLEDHKKEAEQFMKPVFLGLDGQKFNL